MKIIINTNKDAAKCKISKNGISKGDISSFIITFFNVLKELKLKMKIPDEDLDYFNSLIIDLNKEVFKNEIFGDLWEKI